MRKEYCHYNNITREILDTIKVGDLVKVNDWTKPMRVKAVSENYFVMVSSVFRNVMYSVCSKLPLFGGMFYCGPDYWVFGSPLEIEYENLYRFEDEEANRVYLQSFEDGESQISERNGIAIYELYVKG